MVLLGGDVKEPEALVFGAELRCEHSNFRTYLLTEDYFSKEINGLPARFVVSDCKPGINIVPFGDCNAGGPCVSQWMLDDKWTNFPGQDEKFGGEEIITTASFLVCDAYGFLIKPVNSGQHSDIGKQLMYLAEFDKKYPGLRAILEDPNVSLYLQDGMRKLALKFLSDEIGDRGGSIEIGLIAGKLKDGLLSIKNLYILSAIAHLDPVIDVSDQARFVENMQNLVTRMDNGNGANDRYLDKRMFELLDIRSLQVADNVAKGGWGLFYEQHKGSLMALGDMMMGLAQVSVLYSSYTSWAGQQRTQGYSGYERDVRDAEIGQSNSMNRMNNLPSFDGKTTYGILVTADGEQISLSSGGYSQYRNVSATHVEGKAAIYMRDNGIMEATIYHNNTNGTCNYCDKGLERLLPEGAQLTVVPPDNAVAPNRYWFNSTVTYVGNDLIPSIK